MTILETLSSPKAEVLVDVNKLSKTFSAPFFSWSNHSKNQIPVSWALRDITFSLRRSETLGILGANGAGKSTLLKILCGHLKETNGSLITRGKIRALIELGTGLDVYQSGIENVKFYLTLQGFANEEIEEYTRKIHEFSELGEKFYADVKTYSSGMFIRLAYSMQALLPADVLIIDEALAVGDVKFQHKCFTHIDNIKQTGVSILFVSHSLEQIRQLCDRVIVMSGGKIVFDGSTRDGCDLYLGLLYPSENETPDVPITKRPQEIYTSIGLANLVPINRHSAFNSFDRRYGFNPGMIDSIKIEVGESEIGRELPEGEGPLKITIGGSRLSYINLIFGFSVRTKEGVIIFGTNSFIDGKVITLDKNSARYEISIASDLRLKAGTYFIDIGVCEPDGTTGGRPLEVIPSCLMIDVNSRRRHINDGFLYSRVEYHSLG